MVLDAKQQKGHRDSQLSSPSRALYRIKSGPARKRGRIQQSGHTAVLLWETKRSARNFHSQLRETPCLNKRRHEICRWAVVQQEASQATLEKESITLPANMTNGKSMISANLKALAKPVQRWVVFSVFYFSGQPVVRSSRLILNWRAKRIGTEQRCRNPYRGLPITSNSRDSTVRH